MYYLFGDPPPSIPIATPANDGNKSCPLSLTSGRGSTGFFSLLGTASGASLPPSLSTAFHCIGSQRFRVLVKAGLDKYFLHGN